jgi:hypothetical protein
VRLHELCHTIDERKTQIGYQQAGNLCQDTVRKNASTAPVSFSRSDISIAMVVIAVIRVGAKSDAVPTIRGAPTSEHVKVEVRMAGLHLHCVCVNVPSLRARLSVPALSAATLKTVEDFFELYDVVQIAIISWIVRSPEPGRSFGRSEDTTCKRKIS